MNLSHGKRITDIGCALTSHMARHLERLTLADGGTGVHVFVLLQCSWSMEMATVARRSKATQSRKAVRIENGELFQSRSEPRKAAGNMGANRQSRSH